MERIIKVIKCSLLLNLFLALFKVIIGTIGKSRALFVDGIHSFSDLTTDAVVLIGSNAASAPADDKHPYGHGKIEYVMSLFVGGVVLLLGFNIIISINEISTEVPSMIVVYASIFTIVSKLLMSRFLLKKGTEYKSNILTSSGKESGADVITSVFVLVSAVLMQFNVSYFEYADFVASIIIGVFIIKTGFDIIKENTSVIIGEQETDNKYNNKIKKIILNETSIISVDSIVILKFGHYYKLISEVSMDGKLSLESAHDKIDIIEKKIKDFDERVMYITIHMSPYKGERI